MRHVFYFLSERKLGLMSIARCILFCVFAILVILSPFTAEAEDKIGHIDFDELIRIMPGYEAAQKSLEKYEKELASRVENMQKELKSKAEAYSKEESELADSVKVLRLQEILDLDNRIEEYASSADQSYQLKHQEILQPIIEKARQTIADVAKENGFAYILHRNDSIILYFDESRDILPLAKEKLKGGQ